LWAFYWEVESRRQVLIKFIDTVTIEFDLNVNQMKRAQIDLFCALFGVKVAPNPDIHKYNEASGNELTI